VCTVERSAFSKVSTYIRMSTSSPAVTLLSAASMNVTFVATIKQPLMSIASRTRLGRHILRLIKDFFSLPRSVNITVHSQELIVAGEYLRYGRGDA
jgi:hypothetical protein